MRWPAFLRRSEESIARANGIYLRPVRVSDARQYATLLQENRELLEPFEPVRPPSYYTEAYQRAVLKEAVESYKDGSGYMFAVVLDSHGIIGRVGLSGVFRGAFQSCFIGYFIDHRFTRRGYATWAVKNTVAFAFDKAALHRVEASVMPCNVASQRVLEKSGFRREGLARNYLRIQGKWEDHYIYAITVEDKIGESVDRGGGEYC
ncbi:MAG: GNAT family protein [Bacillota bacterium]|jgi:ribosomal-protein-alanine N-acetyltransferase|nr:GNAT family N-acetyltransferase [Bacillota bacterium]HOB91015.1 GNAT family protein [Bacillota bacterium]HPZ54141.1 GNAT family protein [Bacillota bacterium]HQD18063.1 GNAT family protein [Bacillota bacterium]